MRRRLLLGIALALAVLLGWLSLTDDLRVWPVRNTLQYALFERIDRLTGRAPGALIDVQGSVHAPDGKPIPQARVLVAAHNGTPYSAETDDHGSFVIRGAPAGAYVPSAGARGYQDTAERQLGLFRSTLDGRHPLNVILQPQPSHPAPVAAATNFHLDAPATLKIDKPIPSSAVRRAVHFDVGPRHNQTTLFYTPNDGSDAPVPVLLTVYPGSADTWESVSFPLSQAGFAVIAVGPAYALDLTPDVDDLERVLSAVREGRFPRADVNRIGVLGGSYSSLHVFRLLERRDQPIRAALFLGPPTDLFEMRRQFTAGQISPPFGLDKALIALGYPDRAPEPYWSYSARYHARSFNLPIMLVHSKADEIVPFQQSELMDEELRRIGVEHEVHILEGMGHYLLAEERTPAIDDLFNLTIQFFRKKLT